MALYINSITGILIFKVDIKETIKYVNKVNIPDLSILNFNFMKTKPSIENNIKKRKV